jgi:hypothetical protein
MRIAVEGEILLLPDNVMVLDIFMQQRQPKSLTEEESTQAVQFMEHLMKLSYDMR